MRDSVRMERPAGATALLACLMALAACSAHPSSLAVALPPASAGSEVVLDAYLRALVADDCATGRKLATADFRLGNGELCGAVTLSAYKVNPVPAGVPGEVVYSTTITTNGDGPDGALPAGGTTWFYRLAQQPDGSWRLVGGGTGP